MDIIFFANGEFALNSLKILLKSKHTILNVITNEDKISGRGKQYNPTRIAVFATKNNINVTKINDINDLSHVNYLKSLKAEIFIIISYKILSETIYSIPKLGSINIHASLLPDYRGAAPIQRSIMNGENTLGLTSFKLNNTIDTGDIINQKSVIIDDTTTYGEAHDLLANLSGKFLLDTLKKIENNASLMKQTTANRNYAAKITKDELKISLNNKSKIVHNKIRALTPKPGAYLLFNNKRVKIYNSYYENDNKYKLNIGHFIIKNRILFIGCKIGNITCESLQFEGRKKISIKDFSNMNYSPKIFFE